MKASRRNLGSGLLLCLAVQLVFTPVLIAGHPVESDLKDVKKNIVREKYLLKKLREKSTSS